MLSELSQSVEVKGVNPCHELQGEESLRSW